MKKSFTSFLLTFSILMIGMNTSGQGFFGIASGGETMGTHATLYPMLHDAGVTTVRAWPEWKGIEPSNDVWDWTACDSLVASAKANHIELTGVFAYLPAWASASGQERTFPIADIEYYRDYVRTMLTRYKDDVKYWEVYNEFNSPTFNRNGTIEDYVQMTQEAYIIAKQIDPGLKIGISCADVDASFFSNVLSQGASGYVDFIAVHPYSMMSATMDGRETPFLQLGATLREMLVANGEPANLPILITEIGVPSTNDPAREEEQAKGLIKAYILPLAQDVEKVDWFEGRGPDYGNGDFGIIRNDWTIRPSYTALQTMTGLMGATPHYLGWLNPTGSSYCFVFQGATDKVMVSWATDDNDTIQFPKQVIITDMTGQTTSQQNLITSDTPLFITDLPESWVTTAVNNHDSIFPWLADYSNAENISCTMGVTNVEDGLDQFDKGDGETVVGLVDGVYARRTDYANSDYYMYFDADDSYASYDDYRLLITVYARQVTSGGAITLTYESLSGYKGASTWWTPPAGEWGSYTFEIYDASFANNWGWNFRIQMGGSNDVWIQKVVVTKSNDTRPIVNITSPVAGAKYTTPVNININANAIDDVRIEKVEFYESTILLGTDTVSPYSYAWTDVPAGSHKLTAKATDNDGETAISSAVSILVNSGEPFGMDITCIMADPNNEDGLYMVDKADGEPVLQLVDGVYARRTDRAGGNNYIYFYTDDHYMGTSDASVSITVYAKQVNSGGVLGIGYESASTYKNTGVPWVPPTGQWGSYTWTINDASFGDKWGWGWKFRLDATGSNNDVWVQKVVVQKNSSSNVPPSVSITSPVTGAKYNTPVNITLNANASDEGWVEKVEFYESATLLGTDTVSPYSYAWTNVPAGSHKLTAKATDNEGETGTSQAVYIIVNSGGPLGSDVNCIMADPNDEDGLYMVDKADGETILQLVDGVYARRTNRAGGDNYIYFYTDDHYMGTGDTSVSVTVYAKQVNSGGVLGIGYESATTYKNTNIPWVPPTGQWGSYTWIFNDASFGDKWGWGWKFRLDATGSNNDVWVQKVVVQKNSSSNVPPSVSITSPLDSAVYYSPADITIEASASDTDGSVVKVDFYQGSELLGSDTISPYSFMWTGVTEGNYAFKAVVTDNAGAYTTSAPINITVLTSGLGTDLTENGISESSGMSDQNEGSEKAFDNLINTKWNTYSIIPVSLQYDFNGSTSYAVNQYTITSAGDFSGRDPKNWELQASNTGSRWKTLDTRSNINFTNRYETKTFNFSNSRDYRIYRLNVTANHGDSQTQIAEIQMFENGENILKKGEESNDMLEPSVRIYPNPASRNQNIVVNMSGYITGEKMILQVADINGKIIYNSSFVMPDGGLTSITISASNIFTTGTYILTLQGSGSVQHERILIK